MPMFQTRDSAGRLAAARDEQHSLQATVAIALAIPAIPLL